MSQVQVVIAGPAARQAFPVVMATGSMPCISRMARKTVHHNKQTLANMTTTQRSNGAMRMPRAETASIHLLQLQGRAPAPALAPALAPPVLVAILLRVAFLDPPGLQQRALGAPGLPLRALHPAKRPAKRRLPRQTIMTIGGATMDVLLRAQLPDRPAARGLMSRNVKNSNTAMRSILRTVASPP